ncbi:hypothetical protein EJ06DRAFT_497206 [Trichodelitschia bisporula]|uniref:Pentacotripeptide-repeat region of PRORP domain-containing protein n=1 Tax=Trichodelitschia bisporula TaxID=703511 RepID=A0A6G1HRM2_9PEZI|nr:hypothetical protein EJ06DRAFT_497206 [Trichodelitschia bisporula]
MLTCSSCLRRSLRNPQLQWQRSYAAPTPTTFDFKIRGHLSGRAKPQDDWRAASDAWGKAAQQPRQPNTNQYNERDTRLRDPPQGNAGSMHPDRRFSGGHLSSGSIHRELEWLPDPMKLAARTLALLGENRDVDATELVRAASKNMSCVVAWNHLINHLLKNGRVNAALKIYNEMKKRAQTPDAYTYHILLKGLAANAHAENALTKALSIYHSMSSTKSATKPSIMHINAALKACAMADDMDALWSVVATIPETGPVVANSQTYTTILHAIRMHALKSLPAETDGTDARELLASAVMQARRLWEDIISKWRQGLLTVDDNLACSMGRVLLIGTLPQDWDDVFSLLKQTMNIHRRAPSLRSHEKRDADGKILPPPYGHSERAPVNEDDPDAGEEFAPVPARLTVQRSALMPADGTVLTYARPSNSTLSLVLEACQKMFLKGPAVKYWELFTDPNGFNIKPDSDNCHYYLRILRQARASGEALAFLKSTMGHMQLSAKTFRITMSTVVRNRISHRAIKDATEMFLLMEERLSEIDPSASDMYMKLALDGKFQPVIIRGVERLLDYVDGSIRNLKEAPGGQKEEWLQRLRWMHGLCARCLDHGDFSEHGKDMEEKFRNAKSKITAVITDELVAKKHGQEKEATLKGEKIEAGDGVKAERRVERGRKEGRQQEVRREGKGRREWKGERGGRVKSEEVERSIGGRQSLGRLLDVKPRKQASPSARFE